LIVLRPQDSTFRERKSLNGIWEFTLDPDGVFGGGRMAVPASYNDVLPGGRDHVGTAWYRTTAWVPRGWAGQRIVMHFESATHRATVWIGDTEVVRHEGGYTPFEADITEHVTPGGSFVVTVAVDNTLTWESIPPGIVEETASGPRQRYWHDFFNYAGLHRTVWLCATPADHLSSLAVTAGHDGTLTWSAEPAAGVRVVLRDEAGEVVATDASGSFVVADVHPWAPGDGYLYELEAQLIGPSGDVADSYRQAVGFRTVAVSGTQVLVNGEPVTFRGFGKHEDIAVLGKGHNDAYLVHDVALLEWIGANSFRTSHYPYSEDVLDLADRHGIMIIDETAAVGLNTRLAQGTASRISYRTFGPDTIGAATQEVHAQAIRELIARDRNHPCVVMWSIANEPESEAEGADDYFEPLFALARELDPTRPVTFANYGGATHGTCRVSRFADVLLLNRYYGWYVHTGDLAEAERALETELRAWATDGKPIIVSEYGADTYPGLHSIEAEPWTEEYQSAYLEMNHRVFDRIAAVIGEHVWNFADFSTTSGITRVGGNRKGVFTRDRRPKAAAHLLRARWR
jgi:beta-glucuronidase